MTGKKKKYLGTNLKIASIIFTLCISIGMGSIGFMIYYKNMKNQYQKYISGILKITAAHLDGDDIEQCINTMTESSEYQDSQEFMNQVRDNYDIEYIYMLRPLKKEGTNNMMYVMAGVSKDELRDSDNIHLGELTGREFDDNVTEYYIAAMSADDITYYANRTVFGYMYSGLLAVKNSAGEAVAVLAVDMSMKDMESVIYKYIRRTALAGMFNSLVFFAVLYLWIRYKVIMPIRKLDASANAFVQKSHEGLQPSELKFTDPEIHSGDEMQTLSDSLMTLSHDLRKYMSSLMEETKEKERIASELNIAANIQASMLPYIFPPFPDVPEFDIYANMSPAREVGGDFYDFFMLDENRLAIVIADVSGKGVPAALFMVIGKTLIRDYSEFGDSLGEVFTKVNDLLCESNKEELFITAFEGVIDIRTGEMEFVNAGHEKPIVYHKEEKTWEIYPVRSGFVLAGLEGMKYHSGKMNLKKGDKLFLYTDGVPEAINQSEEQYGVGRLLKVLKKNENAGLEELLDRVRADVDKFADEAEQFDDITMLCMEYRGYK